MAQTNFNNTDIDTDTDSDSGRSGNLQFVRRKGTRRSTSHHLLMDAIEGSEEEKVPLPDYERLSQSMRLPEDLVQETHEKTLTHSQSHVQKPIARKLIDKVFKRDGDQKEKEKEKEKEGDGDSTPVNKEKKKRSSWLPDPDKRWPVQGWS